MGRSWFDMWKCVALASIVASGYRLSAETLDDAWTEAMARNPQLAAAKFDSLAAAHDQSAVAAQRWPEIRSRAGYNLRSDEPEYVVRSPLLGSSFSSFPFAQQYESSAGVDVRMPLLTSGRLKNSMQSAAARSEEAALQVHMARLELLYAVGEAYVAVLRAQRELQTAQQELESLKAYENDVARLHAEQKVPKLDELAARAARAGAEQRVLQKHFLKASFGGRYNRLLGRAITAPCNLEERELPLLPYSLDELTRIALQQRPDVLRLFAAADAHTLSARSTEASGRPQLSAVASYDFQENRYLTPQSLATAAVVLDWKLLDGGRTRQAAEAERSRAASIRCLVEDLRSKLAVELLEAWNKREEATRRLDVAEQSCVHTAEFLRTARLRFGGGMSVSSAVLEAQTRTTQATLEFHAARYDRLVAQLKLRYLAGLL